MAHLPVPPFRLLVALLAVAGAVLLVVAEFTPLFAVSTDQAVIKEVKTGTHHSYALIPIAVVALLFTWGAVRGGSRPVLVGLAAMGIIALLVALIHDLPDTSKAGMSDRFALAKAAPKTGMYLETLGSALLIIAAGSGLVLTVRVSEERPAPRRSEGPRPEPS